MKRLIVFFFMLSSLSSFVLKAQTVYTIGPTTGDFPDLGEAFFYINSSGSDLGALELQILESFSQPSTAVLYKSGADGFSKYTSIAIYPANPGVVIQGPVNGPLIELNGAANVTFDGRVNRSGAADMVIFNESTSPNASTIRFTESASYNTVEYCHIIGSGTGSASGTIHFSTAATGSGNDNNSLISNLITSGTSRPAYAIFSLGTSGRENSGNVISNNEIFNFLNASAVSAGVGILSNSTEFTISGNSFYETTSFSPASNSSYYAILINNPSGADFTISDNYIGGKSPLCGGTAFTKTNGGSYSNQFSAISLSAGTAVRSSIQGNTVKNISWSNTGNSTWSGISISAGSVLIGTMSSNKIGDASIPGSVTVTGGASNTIVYAINVEAGGPTDIMNNLVANILNNTPFSGSIVSGLSVSTSGINNIHSNFIQKLFVNGTSASSTVYGIKINSGTSVCSNNIISLGGNTPSTIYGVYETGASGNNNSLYFNTVYINGSPVSGSYNSYALYSAVNTNSRNFRNNLFFNARSNSGATGKHYSMYIASSGGSLICDYNEYYSPGTGGIIGYYAGDQTVLPIVSTQDINSLTVDPLLSSAGGTSSTNYVPATSLPGITGTGITDDFEGYPRSISSPTMGAMESSVSCSNPTSGGTISVSQTGCGSFDPAAFSSTSHASGASGGSIEYKWQQSVTGSGSGFTDIPLANSATYDAGTLTQTTWFKRLARAVCMPDWTGAAESNVISVTINQKPTASISGSSAACGSTVLNTTTNAATPSYEWFKDGLKLPDTGPSLTVIATGSYRVDVIDGVTSCRSSSAVFPVTVNVLPSATISGSASACVSSTLNAVTDASAPSFIWYKDNVEIAGQTASSLNVMASGAYKFKVKDGNTLCENTSALITINPLPLADRIVNGTTSVCSGTSAMITIDLSETGVNYQLRNSSGNINIGSAVSGNGGTINMSTGILPSTTTINILATRSATGCNVQLNETETITVYPPSSGGSISGASASIEYGSSTGTMTLTGYTGSIVKWQKQLDSGTWLDIANTSPTYSETQAQTGIWAYRVNVKSGVCPDALSTPAAIAVTPKPLSVIANDQEKTYGNIFTFAGTEFTASGLVGGDAISGISLTSTGAVASAGVASSPYTITPSAATGTGLGNYTITYVNGALTVKPANLAITATNQSKTYGTAYTFNGMEFSSSGLRNSDMVSSITLISTGSGSNAAVAGSPYSIVPSSATGTGLGNYSITYVNGELTVIPASLTITANNKNKTYGTVISFSGNEFTSAGLMTGDAISGVSLISSGSTENAGISGSPYEIVPSGATGTGLGNYIISYVNGALTVNPASLTITAKDLTKIYGSLYSFSVNDYNVTGLIAGDAVTSVALSSSGADANAQISGSPYSISASAASGTGLGNYSISYVNGMMNVTPASLTIAAVNKSKTYGTALTFAGTEFTVNGLKSWDAVTGVTLTSSGIDASALVSSSPYSIVPSSATGTGLGNYTISYSAGSLTITPAPLSINANNQTKTYGTTLTLNGSEFTSLGLVNGNTINQVSLISDGFPQTASSSGSPYALVPSNATGNGLANYAIIYNNGNLTVNKATLTVTADNKTRKYGENNPPFTLSISGFVNNETRNVIDQLPSVQTSATTTSPAGTYSLVPTGGSDNNYSFIYTDGVLTVTKQLQTITITDLPHKIQTGSTHQIAAESTSGLTVAFESLDGGIAAVTGNNLSGIAKGSARIRAFNAGDQNYEPAEEIVTIEVFSSHKDIMNLFTPDGDGFNDYWELPKMNEWGKCDVRVYNRWGKLVYANPDYSNQWTGTSNGSPLPEGAYYYIITTQNAGVVKGTVNIVR